MRLLPACVSAFTSASRSISLRWLSSDSPLPELPAFGGSDALGRAAAGGSRGLALHVRAGDAIVVGEDDQALHEVLELPHVAGPRLRGEERDGVVVDADVRPRGGLRELGHEVAREPCGVLGALAERRDVQRDDRETVEEILAELAGRDHGLEIAVRGGDDAHVDADGLGSADALELALLDDAQQLHLHGAGNVADLVEEERALVGELDAPWLALRGAGERAFLVTEQLALEEGLGGGRRSAR